MLLVKFYNAQFDAAEAIHAPQFAPIGAKRLVFQSDANARPAGGVEVLNQRLDVPACLPRRDIAAGGQHRHHVQLTRSESQAYCQRVANAGVHIQNDFSRHCRSRDYPWSGRPSLVAFYGPRLALTTQAVMH